MNHVSPSAPPVSLIHLPFMQDQLSALLAKAAAELPVVVTRPDFEAAKARFVGPNGELTALMKQMEIGRASCRERV